LTVLHALGNLLDMWGPLSMLNVPGRFAALHAVRLLLSTVLVIGTSGCASNSYMGISLAPGAADAVVQALAVKAQGGDKQAQLDLGIRLFRGEGVAADMRRACGLFRMAVSDTVGPLWLYTPSPGGGEPAQVLPIPNKTPASGLKSARDWFERCQS
jgi:hypothetical protein